MASSRGAVAPLRNRKLADSPLEGDGFELPVPRAMQARLEAKIAGFGCMSPPIICGCRRWPSAKAQSEISEPNPYRAEPEVRIHLPPAESPRTIGSCPTLQVRRRFPDSFPLLHGHEFGHRAIEHGSIRKLGTSSKAMIIESRC